MPRNKHGYLKADALRSGLRDQYAVVKDGAVHTVEILHDVRQGGFVVQHTIVSPTEREVHTWQVGRNLQPRARAIFEDRVALIGA